MRYTVYTEISIHFVPGVRGINALPRRNNLLRTNIYNYRHTQTHTVDHGLRYIQV
jgi:hypothetical protein